VRALDALARLQLLVDREEVLDLQPVELREMSDVLQVLLPRVVRRDAEDLVVTALLVLHPVHPDRTTPDQAPGKGRLLQQHQRVERIAVLAQRLLDEPVVRGVLRRREQRAVQPDPPRLVVELVLVAPALGDLDGDVELHVISVPPGVWSPTRRARLRCDGGSQRS
jgi:hypothetical protein